MHGCAWSAYCLELVVVRDRCRGWPHGCSAGIVRQPIRWWPGIASGACRGQRARRGSRGRARSARGVRRSQVRTEVGRLSPLNKLRAAAEPALRQGRWFVGSSPSLGEPGNYIEGQTGEQYGLCVPWRRQPATRDRSRARSRRSARLGLTVASRAGRRPWVPGSSAPGPRRVRLLEGERQLGMRLNLRMMRSKIRAGTTR